MVTAVAALSDVYAWVRSRLDAGSIEWLGRLSPTLVCDVDGLGRAVGMAYEDDPGAYWTLIGPGVELRHEPYELDTGDYPFEWSPPSRDDAVAFFETRAVGA